MELKDTVNNMVSEDHKKRFKAEFDQMGIRALRLWETLHNWKDLDFRPSCSKDLLQEQNDIQWLLIKIMKRRAYIEHISLDWDPEKERFEKTRADYMARHANNKVKE